MNFFLQTFDSNIKYESQRFIYSQLPLASTFPLMKMDAPATTVATPSQVDEHPNATKTMEQRRRTSMEQAKAIEDEYQRIINGE